MRFTKKIVERGSLTLPSDIREALGIQDGDFVEFEVVGVLKKGDASPVQDLAQAPIRKLATRTDSLSPRTNRTPNPSNPLKEEF